MAAVRPGGGDSAPPPGSVEALKALGNAAFTGGRFDEAIEHYSLALDGAPTSHVLYSNRAAAYLARRLPGDALNAISDANHAIRLDETYAKAYHRKGCALIQIGEYEDAMLTCQRGIRADPTSTALREALSQAQSGLAAARMREAVEMAAAAAKARDGPAAPPAPAAPAADASADADPLASFYAELDAPPAAAVASAAAAAAAKGDADALDGANPFASEGGAATHDGADSDSDDGVGTASGASTAAAAAGGGAGPATSSDAEIVAAATAATAASLSARLAAQPLGSGASQLDRLLQRNAAWINLNPFEVLLLPPDASDDDVKARFRKLSALVHPDKHAGDEERANTAFQEVKRAAEALHDHARRTVAAATIEAASREARRMRRRSVKSGVAEAALPPWEETLQAETRKAFAEKEHRRRNYERRMKAETMREAEEEVAEHEAMLAQHKSEQEWAKGRDARMGNWVSFAGKKRRTVGDGGEGPTVLSDAMRFGGRTAPGAGGGGEKDYKKRWR